jgi:ABC-type multidrug transport system fused ATPase/permease subunit
MINYKKALSMLTKKEKKNGIYILMLCIGMALAEAIGVASIMPFLAVLGSPEMINSNPILNLLYTYTAKIGIESPDDFLFILGIFSFIVILVSAAFRTYTQYRTNLYIELLRHNIGMRLLESYLRHPYSFFINTNSDELTKIVLSEVGGLITYVFRPFVNMASYGFVLVAILGLLVIIDPFLAILLGSLLGGLYAIVFVIIKKRIAKLGSTLVSSDKDRYTTCGEIFGGIKELKLLGAEQIYLDRFNNPSRQFSLSQAGYQTMSQVPKYVIEAIAFGGIILLVVALIISNGGLNNSLLGQVLPIIGLYAFSAYRIQPALQTVFTGFSALRYGHAIINNIYSELSQNLNNKSKLNSKSLDKSFEISDAIKFDGINYSYNNSSTYVLEELNLMIECGSSIGIVGSTGSGKTTFVDILLGLLRPTSGNISVDGEFINDEKIIDWQRLLGYVPQEIFLTDSTVAENIAFGIPREQIDQSRVEECARMAQVHNFIIDDLEMKYDSMIGQRGVRISGGQRQRIGIARALYRNPKVLVFDEATSALDALTEKAVMNAIHSLSPQKTLFIIAHRMSTIKACDKIIVLKKGRIIATGSYDELISSNADFNALNKAG